METMDTELGQPPKRISDSFKSIASAWEDFSQIKMPKEPVKPLMDSMKCINTMIEKRSWLPMFSVDQVKKEIEKYLNRNYIKSELRRLQKEIESLKLFQRLPEPTQKHLAQLEKRFEALIDSLSKVQKQIDKEFSSALNGLNKRQKEATDSIMKLRKVALQQKDTIEKAVSSRIGMVAKAGEGLKRKAKGAKTKASATKRKVKAKVAKAAKKSSRKKTTRKSNN